MEGRPNICPICQKELSEGLSVHEECSKAEGGEAEKEKSAEEKKIEDALELVRSVMVKYQEDIEAVAESHFSEDEEPLEHGELIIISKFVEDPGTRRKVSQELILQPDGDLKFNFGQTAINKSVEAADVFHIFSSEEFIGGLVEAVKETMRKVRPKAEGLLPGEGSPHMQLILAELQDALKKLEEMQKEESAAK
ncbi:MAG: hypothetical protein ABII19_02225 [Patescibacteria group bacterium]